MSIMKVYILLKWKKPILSQDFLQNQFMLIMHKVKLIVKQKLKMAPGGARVILVVIGEKSLHHVMRAILNKNVGIILNVIGGGQSVLKNQMKFKRPAIKLQGGDLSMIKLLAKVIQVASGNLDMMIGEIIMDSSLIVVSTVLD
jgi:kynurenine formamidase